METLRKKWEDAKREILKYYIANQPWMLCSIYAHSIIVAIINTHTVSIIKILKMKQYCKTMHFQFLPWPTYVFFKKALRKVKEVGTELTGHSQTVFHLSLPFHLVSSNLQSLASCKAMTELHRSSAWGNIKGHSVQHRVHQLKII